MCALMLQIQALQSSCKTVILLLSYENASRRMASSRTVLADRRQIP